METRVSIAGEPKPPKPAIRAFKLELAKPLDRDWNEFGQQLRALRNIAHRCLQGAISNVMRYDTEKVPTPLNPAGKPYNPQTLAYHGANDAIASYNAWAAKKKLPEVYVPSAIVTAWANEAHVRYTTWRKGGGVTQLPAFKHGAAISIPAEHIELIADEQGRPVASIKIGKGKDRVAIVPGKGGNWAIVEGILSGKIKSLSAKITYDERAKRANGSKGKWYLLVSYEAPPKAIIPGDTWLVVHRGERNLFSLLSSGGHPFKRIPGNGIIARKRGLKARMRSIKSSLSAGELGPGARGHGMKRRFAAYTKVEDTLEQTVKTSMRQCAARVAKLATQWGCTGIIIEDYGGIHSSELTEAQQRYMTVLPLLAAKEAMVSAAQTAGLQVREAPAMHISTKCPACGHTHPGNHNHRTGVFHCRACTFGHDVDYVAAYHLMSSALTPTEPNVPAQKLKVLLTMKQRMIAA